MNRRQFIQLGLGSAVLGATGCLQQESPRADRCPRAERAAAGRKVISPGCRTDKVRLAKVYLGRRGALWPTPALDLDAERRAYEAEFASRARDFADVEFVVDELVTSTPEAEALKPRLAAADGVLAIHLSMGIMDDMRVILGAGRPTVLFAIPYSGHDWVGFGQLMREPAGTNLDCLLTTDYGQLAAAVRPIRALHHLRHAKIVNVTAADPPADFVPAVREKFGTQVIRIGRDEVLAAYEAVSDADARAEAQRWMRAATRIVEPTADDVYRSCRLALAAERLLDAHEATLFTVDCYGTMWRQLPAYPCLAHARLNGLGLGGMCESDLRSSLTQMILQGLSGRPGFVNDPTMDTSRAAIILAHCMGTPKMDGPDGDAAPYQLRSIMERQEGCVCQVRMRRGQPVTTAELVSTDKLLYFTGQVIDTPDTPRGCRTKIAVRVDGDAEALWKNWTSGLHRVTCYGELEADLARFCRFAQVKLVNEARLATG